MPRVGRLRRRVVGDAPAQHALARPRRRRQGDGLLLALALVQKLLDLLPEPRGAVEHLGVELVVLRE